jgi:hypothetical protein
MDRVKRIPEPAAITVATVFANLMNKAFVSFSADERLVIEAMRRSSNQLKDMSVPDMGDYLRSLDTESLRGLGNNVKGIYHELCFVKRENLDGDNVMARIFPETNHPGADVIFSRDGKDFAEIQLKATDSSGIVKEHFARYPDIPLAATDEVVGSVPHVQRSGFSDAALEGDVKEAFEGVSDQASIAQLEDAAVVSGLLAAAVNAGAVLAGKATPRQASGTALQDVGIAVTSTYLVDLLFS